MMSEAVFGRTVALCGAILACSGASAQVVEARLSLINAAGVAPLQAIPRERMEWTLEARVVGTSVGMSYFVADLVDAEELSSTVSIESGKRGATVAAFDVPLGIANTKSDGTSLFGGQVADGGAWLRDVGGGQNAFGTLGLPGTLQQLTPTAGVGDTWTTFASGVLVAPEVYGEAGVELENVKASIFKRVLTSPVVIDGETIYRGSPCVPVPVLVSQPSTFDVVSSGGCNPADLVAPFGVVDLSDVDTYVAAFAVGGAVADLAPPFGVVDLADIDVFILEFLAGCPGGEGGDPGLLGGIGGGGMASMSSNTVLGSPCSPADLEAPYGAVDSADMMSFLVGFAAGDPAIAALDGDPSTCGPMDCAVFVESFAAGCE